MGFRALPAVVAECRTAEPDKLSLAYRFPEFRNGTPGKLAVFGRIDAVQLSKTAKNVSRNEHQERKGEKRSLWSRFFVSFEALRMEK